MENAEFLSVGEKMCNKNVKYTTGLEVYSCASCSEAQHLSREWNHPSVALPDVSFYSFKKELFLPRIKGLRTEAACHTLHKS